MYFNYLYFNYFTTLVNNLGFYQPWVDPYVEPAHLQPSLPTPGPHNPTQPINFTGRWNEYTPQYWVLDRVPPPMRGVWPKDTLNPVGFRASLAQPVRACTKPATKILPAKTYQTRIDSTKHTINPIGFRASLDGAYSARHRLSTTTRDVKIDVNPPGCSEYRPTPTTDQSLRSANSNISC